MRVLVAPDSAGGTLDPAAMADAIATGWRRGRADDEVVTLPLSDGGEGLLTALRSSVFADAVLRTSEVVGPRGLAATAHWLLDADGTAVVESAQACGLALLDRADRDPRRTTTWGVGQLLDEARRAGATRVLVGLGGSATVDGGAGALSGLGFRLVVADGSGLKIGGDDLPRVRGAAPTWVADWSGVDVELLADVDDVLLDAPALYGPQKGADDATVAHLEEGLRAWRDVAERDLGAGPDLATTPGSGAAGGLGYGLAAALGGVFRPGAATVGEFVGLGGAVAAADVVLTGEGRLDATSGHGKVVAHVAAVAAAAGTPLGLVVGMLGEGADPDALGAVGLVEASPTGPGADPAGDVAAAAARLARAWGASG